MLIQSHHPVCIFLSELKISSLSKISKILISVGFRFFEFVPANGTTGGLVLAWKFQTDINIICSNSNMINCVVLSSPPSTPWLLIAAYGPMMSSHKHVFWQDLRSIGASFNGAWMVFGDFNSIISQEDKRGGRVFASSSSGGFKDFVDSMGLLDLGFVGHPFT